MDGGVWRKPYLSVVGVVVLSLSMVVLAEERQREYLNDIDVRDIQTVVSEVWPGLIVSINGFRDGCGCEEGPLCTAQMDVVGYSPEISKQMVVSKVDGKWVFGRLQRWRFELEKLEQRANAQRTADYYKVRQHVVDERPVCAKTVDTEYMAELQGALMRERIPFRRDSEGVVHYDESYERVVGPVRKAIERKLHGGVRNRFVDAREQECLRALLVAEGIEHRIEQRANGDWVHWYPSDDQQQKEVEARLAQQIAKVGRRMRPLDCGSASH